MVDKIKTNMVPVHPNWPMCLMPMRPDRQSQYSVMRVLMGEADQGLWTPAEYCSLDYHEGFLSMVRSPYFIFSRKATVIWKAEKLGTEYPLVNSQHEEILVIILPKILLILCHSSPLLCWEGSRQYNLMLLLLFCWPALFHPFIKFNVLSGLMAFKFSPQLPYITLATLCPRNADNQLIY